MPYTPRLKPGSGSRPPRRPAPSCRGGASSLLRLSQPTASRLPSTAELGGWISRAVQALKFPRVSAFAPSEFTAG